MFEYPMSLLLTVPWPTLVNGPSHLQGDWEGGKYLMSDKGLPAIPVADSTDLFHSFIQ